MNAIRDAARSDGACGAETAARDLPVSSRREALRTLSIQLLGGEPSVLLLTGESGTGKSWLWRTTTAQLPASWRWQTVEMTGSVQPKEFLDLLRYGLGLHLADRPGSVRVELAQALDDERRDGRSWLLIIENAQAASKGVWDELLALMQAQEAGTGYGAILLVGPTALTRQLVGREWAAVASRVMAHVHLLPLDLDECRELLADGLSPEFAETTALERLHRDAAGNPRRILQRLGRGRRPGGTTLAPPAGARGPVLEPLRTPVRVASGLAVAPPASAAVAGSTAIRRPDEELPPTPVSSGPAQLLPSRPPLRIEEGLVEVGWAGNLEAESFAPAVEPEASPPVETTASDPFTPVGDETIEDHYAALQAWNEWAANRSRAADPAAASDWEAAEPVPTAEEVPTTDGAPEEDPGARLVPGLRAESQHEHAPYSQLFTRLRQSN